MGGRRRECLPWGLSDNVLPERLPLAPSAAGNGPINGLPGQARSPTFGVELKSECPQGAAPALSSCKSSSWSVGFLPQGVSHRSHSLRRFHVTFSKVFLPTLQIGDFLAEPSGTNCRLRLGDLSVGMRGVRATFLHSTRITCPVDDGELRVVQWVCDIEMEGLPVGPELRLL